MSAPELAAAPLGLHWPTVDPFLFCAHHVDHYPAGDDRYGPKASLDGRDLGQDFAGKDGWRMYHGLVVPGFPQHPHRGFETVTYVRRGLIDHADSLGAAARLGRGDVQWVTAGAGIVHSEMFPLLDATGPNDAELFQIWLNLPADHKMVDPSFTMFWDHEIPRVRSVGAGGATTEITVIAGALDDAEPPAPPRDSWAARSGSDVAIWHARLDPGAVWDLPAAAGPDAVRTLYVFEGDGVTVDGAPLLADSGAVIPADRALAIESASGAECLLLQGRPIGEPVAQYGPFVMNTRAEIEQAIRDYQRTQFGGWPWPSDGPIHGPDPVRFARHADGREERVEIDA